MEINFDDLRINTCVKTTVLARQIQALFEYLAGEDKHDMLFLDDIQRSMYDDINELTTLTRYIALCEGDEEVKAVDVDIEPLFLSLEKED